MKGAIVSVCKNTTRKAHFVSRLRQASSEEKQMSPYLGIAKKVYATD
jgi:hypothetical protein